jgi:hypothetical protein
MVTARSSGWRGRCAFAGAVFGLAACFSLGDLETYPCAKDGTCPPPGVPNSGSVCLEGKCKRVQLDAQSLITFMSTQSCSPEKACPVVAGSGEEILCVANACVLKESCENCDVGDCSYSSTARHGPSSASGLGKFCSFTCDSEAPCPGKLQCDPGRHQCVECISDAACGDGKCCGGSACYPTDHVPSGSSCKPGAGAPSGPCDVVKQDCSSGKCTTVEGTTTVQNQCVPVTGSGAGDAACTRTKIGMDDCAKGFLCSTRPPGADGAPRCLPLCNRDSDCDVAGGRACFGVANPGGGACSPTCSPFDASCGNNRYCVLQPDPAQSRLLPVCSFIVPASAARNRAEGAACDQVDQCLTGMGCEAVAAGAAKKCVRYCDASHVCPSGTCSPIPTAGRGIGACL